MMLEHEFTVTGTLVYELSLFLKLGIGTATSYC